MENKSLTVDFEKAFDNIRRKALWLKLLSHNVCSILYNINLNMYSQIKIKIWVYLYLKD